MLVRVFSGLSRALEIVEKTVLSGGILVVAAIAIANVVARNVFNASLTFGDELAQFFILFVTFMGTSYAARRGRHIRMSAIYDQLPERGRKALMIFIAAVTAALLFVLAFYASQYVLSIRESATVSPALRFPMWVVYLVAPIGLFLAGVQYVLTVVRNLSSDGVYLSWEEKDEYRDEVLTEI